MTVTGRRGREGSEAPGGGLRSASAPPPPLHPPPDTQRLDISPTSTLRTCKSSWTDSLRFCCDFPLVHPSFHPSFLSFITVVHVLQSSVALTHKPRLSFIASMLKKGKELKHAGDSCQRQGSSQALASMSALTCRLLSETLQRKRSLNGETKDGRG